MASFNAVMDSVKTMITPEVSVKDTEKAMIPPEVTNDGKTEPKMESISVQIEQEDQAKRKQTFMDDNCWCNNIVLHPFIAIDEKFTRKAHLISGYGILLTVGRWIFGMWAVVTLPAICCFSGIYCLMKAAKETSFWSVVIYIHNKPVVLSDKGFRRYHMYLLIDFLVTVVLLGTVIGLEAGIGFNSLDKCKSSAWSFALLMMSLDTFIPQLCAWVYFELRDKCGWLSCLMGG